MSKINGHSTTTAGSKDNLAYITGGPRDIPSPSIWNLFKEGLETNPNAIAVISTHQPADHASALVGKKPSSEDPCLKWTFSEIYHGASRVAAGLEAQGVERGTTLLTLMSNRAEWSLMCWVAAMLQLTLVPLDDTLLTPEREEQLRYFLDLLKPATVIVAGAEESKAFDRIAAGSAECVTTKLVASASSPLTSSWKTLETLTQDIEPTSHIEQDETLDKQGQRLAAIMFTSGTSTGRPKGCPVSVLNFYHMMYHRSDFYHLHPSSLALLQTINFRAIHVVCSLATWHNNGGIILAGENFHPKTTLDALEQHKATWLLCVPAHLQALTRIPNASATDTKTLEFMALAGDVVTTAMLETSRHLFPHTETRNILGMTEGTGCTGWTLNSGPSPSINSIPSVGTVLSGSSVKICSKSGSLKPRNEIGEVHLSGANMIRGYFSGEQKELFYTDEENYPWFITGDQGLIDEKGFLYVLGRTKDVIMKNAIPLSPPVIEVFVHKETGLQSQAFGVPAQTSGMGQEPFIVVQTDDVSVVTGLADAIAAGLGKDYRPLAVCTLEQLGYKDWPKNATGKVVKNELREKALVWLREK